MLKDFIFYLGKKYSIQIKDKYSVEKLLESINQTEQEKIDDYLFQEQNVDTLIFGNGDIESIEEAIEKSQRYKLDGVMIGRGVFKNPFIFNPNYNLVEGKIFYNGSPISVLERLKLLKKHVILWKETWLDEDKFEDNTVKVLLKHGVITDDVLSSKNLRENKKNFSQLKKYFKIYISGFDGASQIRVELMETTDIDKCIIKIEELIKRYEISD